MPSILGQTQIPLKSKEENVLPNRTNLINLDMLVIHWANELSHMNNHFLISHIPHYKIILPHHKLISTRT